VPVINLVLAEVAPIMSIGDDSAESKDWILETRGDLRTAEKLLDSTLSSLRGSPDDSQLGSIWTAYVMVEKSVAFIKVELGEENPGKFIKAKVYSVPDERQAVQFALRSLRASIEAFESGRQEESLKALRECRNYLRVLLRRMRLLRTRKTRSAKT
jgi:hypothetical protein